MVLALPMLLVRKAEAGASPTLAVGADGTAGLRRAVEGAHAGTTSASDEPHENAAVAEQAGVRSSDAASAPVHGLLHAREAAELMPDIVASGFKALPGPKRQILAATYEEQDAVPLPAVLTLVVRRLYHPRP